MVTDAVREHMGVEGNRVVSEQDRTWLYGIYAPRATRREGENGLLNPIGIFVHVRVVKGGVRGRGGV